MLDFKPVTLEHKDLIEKYYTQKNRFICDYSPVDIIIWAHNYRTKICEEDGFLFMVAGDGNIEYFMPPISIGDNGDFKVAVEKLIVHAESNGDKCVIINLDEELREKLETAFPNRFKYDEMRDNGDYVYDAQSLITLKGKKLHGKRNHINKFLKEYDGRWEYEELTENNIHDFFDYQIGWSENDNQFFGELCASSTALRNFKYLGIKGGLIRLDGKIIAITLGSQPFDDMYIIHIEKADYDIPGSYQMINQQFAMRNCQNVKYIDREEDLGIEGLRKSKLSYYPEFITKIYSGTLI